MKPIIIDDVDVSKCVSFISKWGWCNIARVHRLAYPNDNLIPKECEGNNCYYKQLQEERKLVQELKETILQKDQNIKVLNEVLAEVRKECSKLEEDKNLLSLSISTKQACYESLQNRCNNLEWALREQKNG